MALVHPNADPLSPPSLYIGYVDALDAIDEKGHVPIPQGTGLGVQINWDWVKKNRTSVTEYD
jgi:L-alanine-DL-glutamate epimerase-like enolase superfamily enzyme